MLTKRLISLVDAIPKCDVLADVGCDHGYIGIQALMRGIAKFVVFTDISDRCLQKARINCPTALQDNATFVCQDGIGDIHCDVAVICGMGGLEIMSILDSAKALPTSVVLQPMRNVVDVRKYIADRYSITLDTTVFDGKFYNIIVGQNVGKTTANLTELEMQFGITNMSGANADFEKYLLNEQSKLNGILATCNASEVAVRLEQVNRALEQIRRKL